MVTHKRYSDYAQYHQEKLKPEDTCGICELKYKQTKCTLRISSCPILHHYSKILNFFSYLLGMTPMASLIRGTQRQEKFIQEKGVSCIDLMLNIE